MERSITSKEGGAAWRGARALCVCLALTGASAGACASTTRLVPEGGFEATRGREHALVGKIWSREARALVPADVLVARVERTPLVAIGETHDHADHHRLQALLLARWLEAQPRAAVAFEMLDEAQGARLAPAPASADELAARVQWDESGWPPFSLYRPIFEVALRGGAEVLAAHPRREDVRASMSGIPPAELRALALEEPLPEAEREALAQEIRDSHCGHASPSMVEGMARAQSFKDAFMARVIAEARRPVVLIAGKGHVGEARGVPLFLARRGAGDMLTIALVEVVDGKDAPDAYGRADVDFLIFTPRLADEDPCERFRAQLEQMRRHHGAHGESAPTAPSP